MRWAAALLVVAVAATVAILVWAISGSRDTVPDDLRSCVLDGGATVVRSNDTLRDFARDLEAGRVESSAPVAVRDRRAVLLDAPDLRILVLAAEGSAPLDSGVARRVAATPEVYSVVAVERGDLRVVERCARRVDADG
ncbi:hypothetical protein [Conexibacter sp. SYSU D00693]|uniref:hypothetical protein n=1 Tax=Conexibacter sp. SYSU D00693 TaxID=2812560 RepID=UPI00196B499D|nr:hypothetical protein [Conexibacter sp. SYSU D00693]